MVHLLIGKGMTDEEEKTAQFLKSNGIDEATIQNFRDNGVTLDMATDINETYLKDLSPQIGPRIKLKKVLQAYIDSQANTSTCTNESGDDYNLTLDTSININANEINNVAVTLFTERSEFPDFDLKTLLSTSPLGKSVLNHYATFGTLDSKRRTILTDIIIRHLYTRIVNCRMTHEEYNIISAKIVSLFPTETVGTYFVRPIQKRNSLSGKSILAKGKLVDKVRNLLYMSGERKRKVLDETETRQNSNTKELTTSESHQAELLWLKNNIDPWEEVQRLWLETYEERRLMKNTSVHDFIKHFRILEDPRCEILIKYDFDKLYPEKTMSIYLNWPEFFDKLKQLKHKNFSDQCVLYIDLEKTIDDEDKKLPLQMEIFGHLVPPKGRLNRKVKFSTVESIEGLIVKVESPGDVEKKIDDIKTRAAQRKLTVQPYILMVGGFTDWTTLYIIVDTVKYQFSSAFKAFDLLFKLYHVFNACYPPATEHLYLIVQRKIYEIVTEYDCIPPYINEILTL